MQQVSASDYPEERIQRLVSGIPFFNEVLRENPEQLGKLMSLAEILKAEPGEVVITRGDSDTFLYFLLKGQLAVMGSDEQKVLNYISPGEVFGTLAMIRGTPRSATIKVDDNARETIVCRVDYNYFSDVTDFSTFNIFTKLAFYRMVVHNIRWTLEVNKMQNPAHPLVEEMRSVPIYAGPKEGAEELDALHDQAHKLADILCKWNDHREVSPAPEHPGF